MSSAKYVLQNSEGYTWEGMHERIFDYMMHAVRM